MLYVFGVFLTFLPSLEGRGRIKVKNVMSLGRRKSLDCRWDNVSRACVAVKCPVVESWVFDDNRRTSGKRC